MKLTVVIVSYNVKHYLVQCLDSVMRATRDIDAEVFVVDNVSPDDSIAYAKGFFPQVHYIQNTENVGFAKANNQAINASTGEYVLLLNPDTIVAEETIKAGVDFLDKHPEAGATGTRMLNRNGSFAFESRRGIPTPITAFYKMLGLCRLFPRNHHFGHYYMRYLDEEKSAQIEVMSGAYMLLRRSALETVGLLSEDYFMYGEDIDLSYQLLTHGYENWYQPEVMLHYKGESTNKDSLKYVHAFYNAMIIFFNKYFVKKYWYGMLLIHAAVILKGILEFFKQKSLKYKGVVANNNGRKSAPERMLFFGSKTVFEQLQGRCQQAGYLLDFANEEQQESGHSKLKNISDYVYVLYQTDEDVNAYSYVLHQLLQGAEKGMKVHLGTYSTKTDTIILPNDVF